MNASQPGHIQTALNPRTGAYTITITGDRVVKYVALDWNYFDKQLNQRQEWWSIGDDLRIDDFERLLGFVPSLQLMHLNPGMVIIVVCKKNGITSGATLFRIGRVRGSWGVTKQFQVDQFESIEETVTKIVIRKTLPTRKTDY